MAPKNSSNKPLLVLFFTVFLDLLGFGLIIPLQPLFAEKLGASGLEVGLLMTTYSAMQLLFAPVWGRLSDRVGRRPILLVSIAGSCGAMLIFAAADSLPVLFLSRSFAGVFNANIGTAQAYVADVTRPEERARGMGLMGVAFGLGFVLGPALGGLLATYGWKAPALAAAGLAAINWGLAYFILPESLKPEDRAVAEAGRASRLQTFRTSLRHPLLPWLFLLFFLGTVGFAQLEATFSLFTSQRFHFGVTENGWLFGLIGVVLALTQGGIVHPLQKRVGETVLLVAGMAVLATGLLLIPAATDVSHLVLACAVIAFGSGLQAPALSSLVSKQAEPHSLGAVLGVNQSMGSLGRIVGPLAAGATFDLAGEEAPFHVAAAILAGATLLAVWVAFRARRLATPAPAPH